MLYLAVQDTHGNINTSVITLPFTTPDVTPPVFLGEPWFGGISFHDHPVLIMSSAFSATSAMSPDDTSLTISATLDKPRSTVYCVILPSPSATPTVDEVFSLQAPQVGP